MLIALAYVIGLAQAALGAWVWLERRERLAAVREVERHERALALQRQQLDALDVRATERLRDCDQLFSHCHISRKAKG